MSQLAVLYTNRSSTSKEAKLVLENAGIDFQEISISDPVREEKIIPQLLTLNGFFEGLDSIRWYAKIYGNGFLVQKTH
jgi:arsenate reductase-like glutaredoxin family protein